MAENASKAAEERVSLRKLCQVLETQRQQFQQLALEWQHFGQFTAAVLQKEVEGFERKLGVLQVRLDQLVQENSELQEMCLYLDKSRDEKGEVGRRTGHGRFQSGTSKFQAPVHSMCVREMNKDSGQYPQYAGITSQITLKDKKKKKSTFSFIGSQGKNRLPIQTILVGYLIDFILLTL